VSNETQTQAVPGSGTVWLDLDDGLRQVRRRSWNTTPHCPQKLAEPGGSDKGAGLWYPGRFCSIVWDITPGSVRQTPEGVSGRGTGTGTGGVSGKRLRRLPENA